MFLWISNNITEAYECHIEYKCFAYKALTKDR